MSRHPRLFVIDDFASVEETARVVELAGDREQLERCAESWERDSAGFVCELRIASDPVLRSLAARMSERVGLANDPEATLRLRAYVEGESHPLHSDAYSFEGLTLIATAMLYVLEPEAGGATRFPAASPESITVLPRRGRLLVWFSLREDGTIDPAAVHEALPVEAGYKIVLNDFFYASLDCCSKIPSLYERYDHDREA